jgi:mRNA interferase MazF
MTTIVKRGDIFYADLSPVVGSEQGGIRPVIILQNDIGNKYSPTIIIAAITSQINKAKLPTHVEISSEEYGLNKDSVVLLEQIRTLDKKRLKEKIGHMTDGDMKKVDNALLISVGLKMDKDKGI